MLSLTPNPHRIQCLTPADWITLFHKLWIGRSKAWRIIFYLQYLACKWESQTWDLLPTDCSLRRYQDRSGDVFTKKSKKAKKGQQTSRFWNQEVLVGKWQAVAALFGPRKGSIYGCLQQERNKLTRIMKLASKVAEKWLMLPLRQVRLPVGRWIDVSLRLPNMVSCGGRDTWVCLWLFMVGTSWPHQ